MAADDEGRVTRVERARDEGRGPSEKKGSRKQTSEAAAFFPSTPDTRHSFLMNKTAEKPMVTDASR